MCTLTSSATGQSLSVLQKMGAFNTGVDSAGDVLEQGRADPHYRETSAGPIDLFASTVDSGWQPKDETSRWISVSPRGGDSPDPVPAGMFAYELRLRLPPLRDLSAVRLRVQYTADNTVRIRQNGGIVTDSAYEDFTTLAERELTSDTGDGRVAGENALVFVVENVPSVDGTGNPSGLLVRFRSVRFAPSDAVPEPPTVLLMLVGSLGVLLSARRLGERGMIDPC